LLFLLLLLLLLQVTLEPYERDHAMVVGVYRPPAKK
jgi:fibrillarin-like rRNA methylase